MKRDIDKWFKDNPQDIKLTHLKDEENNPIGTVAAVADREHRKIKMGLALLNPKDKFNKRLGRVIAIGKAIAGKGPESMNLSSMPNGSKILEEVENFKNFVKENKNFEGLF